MSTTKPILLAFALLASIAGLAPLASATGLEEEGCAVTPGGWGAPAQGNNPASLLHANFDAVFGDALVVDGFTFESAQEITDTFPVHGDPLLNHAVALAINLAFGGAGLLDGTLEGVIVLEGRYDGDSAEDILAMLITALADPNRSTSKYSALIDAASGLNEERFGCNPEGGTLPTPTTPTPPVVCPAMPATTTIQEYTATGANGTTTDFADLSDAANTGQLQPGDWLSVTFVIAEGCEDIQLSLVSYQVHVPFFVLHDFDTGVFDAGVHTLGPIEVPPCAFEVDFVFGGVIVNLSREAYGARLIDFETGGSGVCAPPTTPPLQPQCPVDLVASAQGQSIVLVWDAPASTDLFNVYRSEAGGEPELIASVLGPTFTDTDTVVGATYTYMVTSLEGNVETEECETATFTAVPFFGGAIGMALAALGAVCAFVLLRRKA